MTLRAILIAGPTASGKSSLGLRLAAESDGEIVNADSMQVYADLRILTARPPPEEESRVPHHLFGVLPVTEICSTGRWLTMVRPVLKDIAARGRVAILVGGTGLYFRAALQGLAAVPEIPDDVRAEARKLLAAVGPEDLLRRLAEHDPETAAQLRVNDSQRIVRAWEVLAATGRPLSQWQAETPPGPLAKADAAGGVEKLALFPDRPWLYDRINRRFEAMVAAGALDEVQALMARNLSLDHPVMKALGVPALMAYLDGRVSRDAAIGQAQTQTRRYAKRQMTWLRNQFPDWRRLDEKQIESFSISSFSNI